MTEVYWYKVI